jgi:hypothetical protein
MPCSKVDGNYMSTNSYTLTFTLRDETSFYNGIASKSGIIRDWLQFGVKEIHPTCLTNPKNPCGLPGNKKWINYPVLKKGPIPDPRDMVNASTGGVEGLRDSLLAANMEVGLRTNIVENLGDRIDSFTWGVILMQNAAAQMHHVKELAKQEQDKLDKQRKQFIIGVLGWVVMILPFVGEAGAALAGVSNIVRMLIFLGMSSTSLALGVYDIIQDPSAGTIVMQIFALITGLTPAKSFTEEMSRFVKVASAVRKFRGSVETFMAESLARDFKRFQAVTGRKREPQVCLRKGGKRELGGISEATSLSTEYTTSYMI